MTDHSNQKNHPVAKHRDGALESAVWKHETDKGPVFNVERTRSYKDKDGNWQKTHIISERDLLKAARLDQKAYESIQELRAPNREKYIEQQKNMSQDSTAREHPRER